MAEPCLDHAAPPLLPAAQVPEAEARWPTCSRPAPGPFRLTRSVAAALLLVPLLSLGISARLLAVRGPFWLGSNSDPDYVYLLDSAFVAAGDAPGFFGHPGTPVSLVGAAVLRTVHGIAPGHEIIEAVLADPEKYLRLLTLIVLCLVTATLAVTGALVWRYSGSVAAALISQSTLLISDAALRSVVKLQPEPLLLCVSALVAVVVMRAGTKQSTWRAILLGAVCGVSIALKVTALPLLVLPWILFTKRRDAIVSTGASIAVAALATIPGWQGAGQLTSMSVRIATHAGAYGRGRETLIDVGEYLAGIQTELLQEPLAMATVLAAVALCVRTRADRRVLLALAAAILGSVLLVARHATDMRYLVPGLGLIGPTLGLCYAMALRSFGPRRTWRAGLGVLAALAIWRYSAIDSHLESAAQLARSHLRAAEVVSGYGEVNRLLSYGASALPYALHFGNAYTGNRLDSVVGSRYPNVAYLDPFSNWPFTYVDFRPSRTSRPIFVVQGWIPHSTVAFVASKSQLQPIPVLIGKESVYELR